jgi:hypothetical protein
MANYPGALSTNANLYIAVNGLQTTLAVACTSGDTTLTLTSTTGFPTTGLVTIDNTEVVSYTGIAGATITGCTRGADGTTAASHPIGVTVGLTVVAAHHNLLKDEVIAIETSLGANLSNVQAAGNYITALTSDVSAIGPGSVTSTVNSVGGSSAANVHSAELAANAATNANTASTIVKRDGSGNFSAGTVTASLTGAASSNVLKAGDTMTGDLTMDNDKAVIFKETTVNGTDSVTMKAPASVTTSYTIQLPPAVASAGQVLTDAAGNGVLSWSSPGSGTVTSVSGTTNQITSTNPTTTPVLAIANPLTLPGAMTAGGAIAMASNKITGLANGTASTDGVAFGQIFYGFQALVTATTTTNFSTTSSTFQNTNLTATIPTLTNSAHRVKITVSGAMTNSNPNNTAAILSLTGTTNGTIANNGFCTINGTLTSQINTPAAFVYIDSPGTTTAQTYRVIIKSSDNTTSVSFPGFNEFCQITLEEIV